MICVVRLRIEDKEDYDKIENLLYEYDFIDDIEIQEIYENELDKFSNNL